MRPIEEPMGHGCLFTFLSAGPRKSTWRLGEPKAGGPWLSSARRPATTAHPTDGALPPREGPLTAQCRQAAWQGSGHPQLQACSSTSGPLSGEIRADLHGAGAAPAALAYVLSLQPHQHPSDAHFPEESAAACPREAAWPQTRRRGGAETCVQTVGLLCDLRREPSL